MTKSIPVFAFVFAAFAATSGRGRLPSLAPAAERDDARAPATLVALRTLLYCVSQAFGDISVKVAVAVGEPDSPARLARSGAEDEVEPLWLTGVGESPSGFFGYVAETPVRLAWLRRGQRIHFDVADVLDWIVTGAARSEGGRDRFAEPPELASS